MLIFAVILGALLDPVTWVVMGLAGLLSRPWWGVLLAVMGLEAGGYALRHAAGDGMSPMVFIGTVIGYSAFGFTVWLIRWRAFDRKPAPSAPPEDSV